MPCWRGRSRTSAESADKSNPSAVQLPSSARTANPFQLPVPLQNGDFRSDRIPRYTQFGRDLCCRDPVVLRYEFGDPVRQIHRHRTGFRQRNRHHHRLRPHDLPEIRVRESVFTAGPDDVPHTGAGPFRFPHETQHSQDRRVARVAVSAVFRHLDGYPESPWVG